MAVASRTFRIFVSSTFEGLEAERNGVHDHVSPELRAFCIGRDARFQAIDLRWGKRGDLGVVTPLCVNARVVPTL